MNTLVLLNAKFCSLERGVMQDITDPGEKGFTLVLLKFSLTLKLLTRQSRPAVLLPSKASDSSSSQGRALSMWAILSLQQTENTIRNRLCHASEGRKAAPTGRQGIMQLSLVCVPARHLVVPSPQQQGPLQTVPIPGAS